ncbi:hypothetical protein CHS0354_036182 [Potamilus streckersoni]|uniref:Uncharacterized protein n=1 Tax=Potamilus streckersoni TaxID=2493646 RepID=A0AAE0SW72_9BIVA|nr:hypothetical protein CHS0354_036182 [Potamilus streckersoni]
MNQNPTNMDDLLKAAMLAEKSINCTDNNNSSTLDALLEEFKQIKDEIKAVSSEQNIKNNSQLRTEHQKQQSAQNRTSKTNHSLNLLYMRKSNHFILTDLTVSIVINLISQPNISPV